jgi:hypothetical protein
MLLILLRRPKKWTKTEKTGKITSLTENDNVLEDQNNFMNLSAELLVRTEAQIAEDSVRQSPKV